MLGLPMRYWLQHPGTAAKDLVTDPAGIWARMQDFRDAEREQQGPRCDYEDLKGWEGWLHERIGAEWPCHLTSEFWTLWAGIMDELRSMGIQPGPESYEAWNDGDAGFVRALWCLIRHLKPQNVIETGVAHGVTSRFILEALERNGSGHLWSIDLPPLERPWRKQIGVAVGDRHRDRWTFIEGSSRRQLPALLSKIGPVDLFIHDSLHSGRNVRFEFDQVWPALAPHGVMVADDIDSNWGFQSFRDLHPGLQSVVCEAEPIRPDLRRFNHKGLFGVILKEKVASGSRRFAEQPVPVLSSR